jgi:hemoglobin
MTGNRHAGSLYERIGGEFAVQAAVDLFYEKVLADSLLSPFFSELDMARQVRKQVAFMTWAFDGPTPYTYRDLTTAHRDVVKRGVGNAHFDAVAKHLRATLQELEIPHELIDEVMGLIEKTRSAVLAG